jgi:hypothetical protein
MNHPAQLDFRKIPEVAKVRRSEDRMKIMRMFMMVVIAGTVVLAIISESRLSPEQRAELFKATYAYP